MALGEGREAYERARKAVDAGRFEEAIGASEEAHRLEPEDGPIRELYVGLHLARGVRLSAAARDLRRQEIVARDIPGGEEFQDSESVTTAFQRAPDSFDAVRGTEPGGAKAPM